MKKLSSQLVSQLNDATIYFQKEIVDRLKLYIFAKSAIQSYCKSQFTKLEGYDFHDFKGKFGLINFQKGKEIKNIDYKDIVAAGDSFVKNELADSIFVRNISAFENWLLTMLKHKFSYSKGDIYSEVNKKGEDLKKVDISLIKDASTLEELWGTIIDKYLQNLPYGGMKRVVAKLLKELDIDKKKVTTDTIERINESSLCRNIIVHNQKKVDGDYIKKCGKYARFKTGDIVRVTEDILFEQGDYLLRFMQDFRNNINPQIGGKI